MKNTIITIALLAMALQVTATQTEKLTIEKATVFLYAAQLTSTAKVSLHKGENEILFTNVAGDVPSKTILVNTTNGVAVMSTTFQNFYLVKPTLSPKASALKDSIETANDLRKPIANRLATVTEQISILQTNKKIAGDKAGLSVLELQKMLDLVGTKMEQYLNNKASLEQQLAKIDERIENLKKQLEEEGEDEEKNQGQILVKFYAPEAITTRITIKYMVEDARWSPIYDVFANSLNSPLNIYYKANVYQNTGVNWDNVRLTLSTGNPSISMKSPNLEPWYLSIKTKLKEGVVNWKKPLVDPYKKSNSNYVIDGVAVLDTIPTDMSQGEIEQLAVTDNTGINTEFEIDIPYSIVSDGEEHLVAIKKYEVPATYEYFIVPKIDKDAFLLAKLTSWQDLNLLPGPTNIFYEGTFIGLGNINPALVTDTLTVSLGRDKKVIVKRERDVKLRSVKAIGTNVRETFAYNISVRNTRKEPINIVMIDQIPVSNDKDIDIYDTDYKGATLEENTGKLTWGMTVNANETQKKHLAYSIKYPKGMVVNGLK